LKKKDNKRHLFMYKFGNRDKISIGKIQSADIIINDFSISDIHAHINLYDNNYYISDNKSNYGTMVLVQNNITLLLNKTLTLQIKDMILSLELKEKNCLYNMYHTIFKSNQIKLSDAYKDYSEIFGITKMKQKSNIEAKVCSFYQEKTAEGIDEISPTEINDLTQSNMKEITVMENKLRAIVNHKFDTKADMTVSQNETDTQTNYESQLACPSQQELKKIVLKKVVTNTKKFESGKIKPLPIYKHLFQNSSISDNHISDLIHIRPKLNSNVIIKSNFALHK